MLKLDVVNWTIRNLLCLPKLLLCCLVETSVFFFGSNNKFYAKNILAVFSFPSCFLTLSAINYYMAAGLYVLFCVAPFDFQLACTQKQILHKTA